MALARVKTWVKEKLFFSDLNAEFDNLLNNGIAIWSPALGDVDFNGMRIDLDDNNDTSIRAAADDIITFEMQGFDGIIFDGDVVSPVNGLTIKTAATGSYPSLTAHSGTDTDVGIEFVSIGSGNITFTGGTGAILVNAKEIVLDANLDTSITCDTDDRIDFRLQGVDLVLIDGSVANPVNGMIIATTATGVPATITAFGETPAGLNLVPSGAEQIYIDGGVLAGKCYNATNAFDSGSIAAGASRSEDETVTGVVLGDFVIVSPSIDIGDWALTGKVQSANTVTVTLHNTTLGAADLGAFTIYIRVLSLA